MYLDVLSHAREREEKRVIMQSHETSNDAQSRPPAGRVGRRSFFVGAGAVAAAAGLAACSTSGGLSESNTANAAEPATPSNVDLGGYDNLKGKKVCLGAAAGTSPAQVRVRQALEALAGQHGFELVPFDSAGDYKKLSDTYNLWASQGVDAVMANVTPTNMTKEGAAAVRQKNIPFVGVGAGYGEFMNFDVSANAWTMSSQVCMYARQRILDETGADGVGGVALYTWPNLPDLIIREQFAKTFFKFYETPILSEQVMQVPGQVPDAQNKTRSLLARFPKGGELKCIVAGWDEIGVAAAKTIAEAGRDDVFVVSIDGNLETFEAMKQGLPFGATASQDFNTMADVALQQLNTVLGGGEPIATAMYIQAPLVTKNNLPPAGQYPKSAGIDIYYQA